jgi:hypothetical protein
MTAGTASAAVVYSDTYTAPGATYTYIYADTVTTDGMYLVENNFTLEQSFTVDNWSDLHSAYSDITASLTFTWHDDPDYNWQAGRNLIATEVQDISYDQGAYVDYPLVSIEGTTIIDDVEIDGSAETYTYWLTASDLLALSDGTLDYIVSASNSASGRQDFILNSVTLTIEGTPSAVPIPGAAWLLFSGLAGLGVLRKRTA